TPTTVSTTCTAAPRPRCGPPSKDWCDVAAARDAGLTPALGTDSAAAHDTSSGFSHTAIDSALPSAFDADARGLVAGRWLGWRRRALVVLALLGCVGLFTLLRTLSASPHID